ncbi:hypothetical protein V5740_10945 [Croceibacterium sp. TMG7-5b_MA50]|uniref:hypothetical protein n=1 Tax=Croceibacterium sp. TMG7-5b_MA50 TaxID=3121290 RepID=UPI0032217007
MATRPDADPIGRQRIPVPGRPAFTAWRRVTRARDLVALWVSWRGLELRRQGGLGSFPGGRGREGDALVAGADGGLLRVRFDFQHMAEQALFAAPPPLSDPAPGGITPPVPVRAAGQSRLVLEIPAGEMVEWSVAGLLAAIGRWPMVVAPSAQPAAVPPVLIPGPRTIGAPLADALKQVEVGLARRLPQGAANLLEGQRAMVAANRLARGGVVAARDTVVAGAQARGQMGELLDAGGRLGRVDRRPDHLEVDDSLLERLPDIGPRPRWTLPNLRAPTSAETAIEAPFRLLLSPSVKGGWSHAAQPVEDAERTGRVELWHSRLGVRDDAGKVDEGAAAERIVRAIWTRDRDGQAELPFLNSLKHNWREAIVLQSAGCADAPNVRPRPAQVRRMALSSVGAWIDLAAAWNPDPYVKPFDEIQKKRPLDPRLTALSGWEHIAPMGRDQYVRVDIPGYLFPLGHRATLVTITYRQIVGATRPQAALFQKQYIQLNEKERTFTRRDLPFVHARIGPSRSPDLTQQNGSDPFWPIVQATGEAFEWKIETQDHDGQPVQLQAALVFVPLDGGIDTQPAKQAAITNLYAQRHPTIAAGIPANGQQIAFAPALAAEEGRAEARASAEVARILLGGEPRSTGSTPFMRGAEIAVPAIQRLTPEGGGGRQVAYPKVYKDSGFSAANAGNVYLELVRTVGTNLVADTTELAFGSSERAGGFIKPDVIVAGLSRANGLVSNVQKAAEGKFDPAELFGTLPKLFGIYNLFELVAEVALDHAPKFVTEALDTVAALLDDLARLREQAAEWGITVPPTPQTPKDIVQTFDEVKDAIADITAGDLTEAAKQRVEAALAALPPILQRIAEEEAKKAFEPVRRATIGRLVEAVNAALENEIVQAVLAFAEGIVSGGEFRARMEWRPRLVKQLPAAAVPVLVFANDRALTVTVEARAAGARPAGLEVTAQLSDFHFNLVPGFELMEVSFKRIAFVASASRRPEIDIVFDELKFVGVLSFVEVLKDLIPLDGFSDPPFLDVSTEGISAGFTLALPNLAIGVFSLTNLSLGADARVPFLGDTPVSVGFNFCTRERPFTLAVAFLGGGGFIGIRLDPEGLVMLEGAFEFGAVVALDFGVASGSVSVMAGIYFKIEGDAGQLTGYVRIRGEVDVLGLISASLELYLALTYYTAPQDKLVGEAQMTIKVEVLFFSTSVSVKARRVFAGSNGDPTVRDMLEYADGQSKVWDEYLAAFAGEQEG